MAFVDASHAMVGGEVVIDKLAIGIGCSSRATSRDVLDLIEQAGIIRTPDTILGTLDRRSAVGQEVAEALGLTLRLFSAVQLAEVPRIEYRSKMALESVGTHSVAEASALACLGPEARLITPRKTGRFCTCAAAVLR